MKWNKEFSRSYVVNSEFMLVAVVLLFIVGLFIKQPLLYLIMGVFMAYYLINKSYNYFIGTKLILENERKKIRLFVEEESDLIFEFSNESFLPMINGVLEFQMNDTAIPTQHDIVRQTYWNHLKASLSLISKGKTVIRIPIKASQRGTSYIQNITYTFPHLFNFEPLKLNHLDRYKTEIIVYPEILPVKNIETVLNMVPGTHRNPSSPFEEILNPLGTRDYNYSDPFQRINWKASAKASQLQTNIYEKVIDLSYLFIVNLDNKSGENMLDFSINLEKVISNTAYLCRYATERSIPFELFINTRNSGRTPYLHLLENVGINHYGKALETLARIKRQALVLPFEQMLYQAEKQFDKMKTIIIIGEVSGQAEHIINRFGKKHNNIFHIIDPGEEASLKIWAKEVIKRAT